MERLGKPHSYFLTLAAVATLTVVLLIPADEARAYDPCYLPPTVGAGTNPNVLIVMDYSGSMQFAAYYDYAYERTGANGVYTPRSSS
ncbi:MAG: hypothetical protein V2B18_12945, partial [Pseudomonadota bacterium]